MARGSVLRQPHGGAFAPVQLGQQLKVIQGPVRGQVGGGGQSGESCRERAKREQSPSYAAQHSMHSVRSQRQGLA